MNEHTQFQIVDLRKYIIKPRCMAEFLHYFDHLAMPLLMKHLENPVGFYTTTIGTLNQFVHIWQYRDLADYERRSNARDADPAFGEYLQATKELVISQETQIIRKVVMNNQFSLPGK